MFSYEKLWNELEKQGKTKNDLRKLLSSATVSKLSKNEYISMESIEKICNYLSCQPGDLIEIPERNTEEYLAEKANVLQKALSSLMKLQDFSAEQLSANMSDTVERLMRGENIIDIIKAGDAPLTKPSQQEAQENPEV